MNPHDLPTLEDLARDIEARLRRVCDHLPEEEFQTLVSDIAETRLHFLVREREIAIRKTFELAGARPPSLARAIGSLPRLQRPPVSRPPSDELRPGT